MIEVERTTSGLFEAINQQQQRGCLDSQFPHRYLNQRPSHYETHKAGCDHAVDDLWPRCQVSPCPVVACRDRLLFTRTWVLVMTPDA